MAPIRGAGTISLHFGWMLTGDFSQHGYGGSRPPLCLPASDAPRQNDLLGDLFGVKALRGGYGEHHACLLLAHARQIRDRLPSCALAPADAAPTRLGLAVQFGQMSAVAARACHIRHTRSITDLYRHSPGHCRIHRSSAISRQHARQVSPIVRSSLHKLASLLRYQPPSPSPAPAAYKPLGYTNHRNTCGSSCRSTHETASRNGRSGG